MGAKKVQEKERVVKGLINIRSTGEGYYSHQTIVSTTAIHFWQDIRDSKYFTACWRVVVIIMNDSNMVEDIEL